MVEIGGPGVERSHGELEEDGDEEEEEADTLAGLIFKIAGRVPARGEIIRHASGLEFEIIESDPRRVKKLRISTANVARPGDETADDGSG